MNASPKVVCPECLGVGMIALGQDILYCMCETGREKKRQWLSHPLAYEPMRDLQGNVMSDWLGTGRAAEEKISRTLADDDDMRGAA